MRTQLITAVARGKGIKHPAWALGLKRIFDVMFSLSLLFAIWPLFVMLAIAVKVSNPGPIFYRGIRSGLYGKPFRIFKFRTMVENAEDLGGPTTGTKDPRVTRLGAILRRTKLDELPQLLNVLVGDMSLVGPRPEVLKYTTKYDGNGKCILGMRPGITDYASIEFVDLDDLVGSHDPDGYFQKKILPRKNELRIKYVKEWSLASDLKIIWATFCRLIKKMIIQ